MQPRGGSQRGRHVQGDVRLSAAVSLRPTPCYRLSTSGREISEGRRIRDANKCSANACSLYIERWDRWQGGNRKNPETTSEGEEIVPGEHLAGLECRTAEQRGDSRTVARAGRRVGMFASSYVADKAFNGDPRVVCGHLGGRRVEKMKRPSASVPRPAATQFDTHTLTEDQLVDTREAAIRNCERHVAQQHSATMGVLEKEPDRICVTRLERTPGRGRRRIKPASKTVSSFRGRVEHPIEDVQLV